MKIRLGTKDDIVSLKKLWIECFSDSEEYIEQYFKYRFPQSFPIILEENREVLGMVHLIPCQLAAHQGNQKAFYWYAAGIAKKARKKGLFQFLVSTVIKGTQNHGYQNLCVPVKHLFNFYQKNGFCNPYYTKDYYFNSEILKKCDISNYFSENNAKNYFKNNWSIGSVIWNDDDIHYGILENQICGGEPVSFYINNQEYFACCTKKDDTLILEHTNLMPDTINCIGNNLLERFQVSSLILRKTGTPDGTAFALCDSDLVTYNSTFDFSLS